MSNLNGTICVSEDPRCKPSKSYLCQTSLESTANTAAWVVGGCHDEEGRFICPYAMVSPANESIPSPLPGIDDRIVVMSQSCH